ncbi:hypothetical protein IMCC9480_20 [Oxalobacteraceae bacterium IMCC9480]|nr:hypothetical protein IMCC9480_20 [Oxalobacteraceae bacterium IMCC9480]
MTMDRYAVIWTRTTGQPVKLADMVLNDQQLRITRTDEAMAAGLPGVSMLHDLAGLQQIVYARGDTQRLPPQLQALIPPRDPHNLQRLLLGKLLAREVQIAGMKPLDQEWHMLTFAGHGGIGHLDVFKSDAHALQYYGQVARPAIDAQSGAAMWSAFRRLALDIASQQDEDLVMDTLGPTPAVSGFVPKLVVPIRLVNGVWEGAMGDAAAGATPAVVKLETYPGLVALEELAYAVHRKAGIATPKTWAVTLTHAQEPVRMLAVERFDRTGDGRPIPVESLFSLLRTGNPRAYGSTTDGSMEKLGEVLSLPGLLSDPVAAKRDLYRRFVLAILTGNGDLHTENIALQGGAGSAALTPVFDPAPMRAYRHFRKNHNLLSALPFGGIGGYFQHGEAGYNDYVDGKLTPPDLGKRLVDFGVTLGLSRPSCKDELTQLLACTADYADEVRQILDVIPTAERKPMQPDSAGFLRTLGDVRLAVAASYALPGRGRRVQ